MLECIDNLRTVQKNLLTLLRRASFSFEATHVRFKKRVSSLKLLNCASTLKRGGGDRECMDNLLVIQKLTTYTSEDSEFRV